jgi:hypothetical protein
MLFQAAIVCLIVLSVSVLIAHAIDAYRIGHSPPVLTGATHYYQNWHIQTAGFPNVSIFVVCVSGKKPDVGSIQSSATRASAGIWSGCSMLWRFSPNL